MYKKIYWRTPLYVDLNLWKNSFFNFGISILFFNGFIGLESSRSKVRRSNNGVTNKFLSKFFRTLSMELS